MLANIFYFLSAKGFVEQPYFRRPRTFGGITGHWWRVDPKKVHKSGGRRTRRREKKGYISGGRAKKRGRTKKREKENTYMGEERRREEQGRRRREKRRMGRRKRKEKVTGIDVHKKAIRESTGVHCLRLFVNHANVNDI